MSKPKKRKCSPAKLAAAKAYREANADKVAASKKTNYERHKEEIRRKQREYYENHKDEILAKRKENYPEQWAKDHAHLQEGLLVRPREAARLLGVEYSTMRSWVERGKIPVTRTEGMRPMIARSEIDALLQSEAHGRRLVTMGRPKGQFVIPDGFDIVREYDMLSEYTEAFAAGNVPFLLLIGTPGSGKSRQVKGDIGSRCKWIDSHATNCGLYCTIFEAKDKPIVLDDVNHFLNNKQACSLIKSLTQTETSKHINWESTSKVLAEREVPREFDTKSPVCMIANVWNPNDADMMAIQDRSLPVAFCPSAETIHQRVLELGWCDKEITDFIGDNLSSIPDPSMRDYYLASCYRKITRNWKDKLLTMWEGI